MSNNLYLDDLDPQQRIAVEHGEGPLLVFAGAGSGKTRVLTRRIAKLILEHGVHPARILAVTFTNKAAEEMKSRVLRLLADTPSILPAHLQNVGPLWVATFHSICTRILRAHAPALDYSHNFVIYDSSDSLSAMKRVYKKVGVDPKIIDPKMVLSRIDRAKNDYKFPEDLRRELSISPLMAESISELYIAYQEELKSSQAMDFGDLLCNVITLFKLEKEILGQYQEQFLHFLVDEYQDTNRVQYLFVQMLTEKNKNLCVVGDDDQSIYAFRGATIKNILTFQKDYPNAQVVTLAHNYRSTKNILRAASAVISKNKNRQKKELKTNNPTGEPIVAYRGYDEIEEAHFVVQTILTFLRKNTSPSQIAIFYRTNAQSRVIEEYLVENNIPYEIYGSHKFYERKEIKDILAYYRLLLNPCDNESLLRIINTPVRGLGPKAISGLVAYAGEKKLSLFESIKVALAENAPFLSTAYKSKFASFVQLIESLQAKGRAVMVLLEDKDLFIEAKITAMTSFIEQIGVDSRYIPLLQAEDTSEAEGRIENIYELCSVGAEFVRRSVGEDLIPSLRDFLDRVSLTSALDREGEISAEKRMQGTISLMTLHLAKGLEFEIVFLVGLEEGLLPHVRSLTDASETEEERRLCYVGMTRAKSRLYLTRVTSRQHYGPGSWYTGRPSRFINDIPPSIVDDRRTGFFEVDAYSSAG